MRRRYFDCVTSNHFPVDPIYKNRGEGNFLKAFNGMSTLGFTLQVMNTLMYSDESPDMHLKALVSVLC